MEQHKKIKPKKIGIEEEEGTEKKIQQKHRRKLPI